jgi:hypothetical protein
MRPLPTHYQSLKNGQPMEIAQMATPYIDNAIRKIQDDRHHIYTPSHAVVWALYQEVLKRARQEATQKAALLDSLLQYDNVTVDDLLPIKRTDLEDLRSVAIRLASRRGAVSADVLREYAAENGYHVTGKLLQHVFRDRRFKYIGFQRSSNPVSKGRFINVWALRWPTAA